MFAPIALLLLAQLGPYHPPVHDSAGNLLPWGLDDEGPFHATMALQAAWWRDAPDHRGWPVYLTEAQLRRDYSQVGFTAYPASTVATGIYAYLEYWAYTGDRAYLDMCRTMGEYVLRQMLTPASMAAYPRFPYGAGAPGDIHPDGRGEGSTTGVVMPDKGAMVGVALLQLWQATGDTAYRDQAIQIANVLADVALPGNAERSPWPFRAYAGNGLVTIPGSPICGNQSFALRLYDELLRLGIEGNGKYRQTRENVWTWLRYTAIPEPEGNLWQQFFDDVSTTQRNRTPYSALEMARYLLEKREALDPEWFALSSRLIAWVRDGWIVHSGSFTSIAEQEVDRSPYNCHTARYASILAMFHEAGGPASDKAEAYSSFAYATYSVDHDGFADTNFRSGIAWSTASFGDWMRHYLDGIGAIPEWAPPRQDHLLRSTSVVQAIDYRSGAVAYATFEGATDVLRLSFFPQRVTADGVELGLRPDLLADGYTVTPAGGGDHVLRIRHSGKVVGISSTSEAAAPPAFPPPPPARPDPPEEEEEAPGGRTLEQAGAMSCSATGPGADGVLLVLFSLCARALRRRRSARR